MPDVLDNLSDKMLIIGQPEKVGLTTLLLKYYAEKLFFEEDYSVLFLVNSNREKLSIAKQITTYIKECCGVDTAFDLNSNVLKVFNNAFAIINYKKNDIAQIIGTKINFQFHHSVIENDEKDEVLDGFYLTEFLPMYSKHILVCTYDQDDSIFYMPDAENIKKIIVYSDLSKKNIMKLSTLPDYTEQKERLTKGHFTYGNRSE